MNPVAKTRCEAKHEENEDHIAILVQSSATIFAVADGIGLHSFGGSVAKWFSERLTAIPPPPAAFVDEIAKIYLLILQEFEDFGEMLDSGSSIACVRVSQNVASFVWAGDSPILLFSADTNESIQISKPHVSPNGALTEYFMGNHPFSPSTANRELSDGDLIVIGSDGANLALSDLADLYESSDLEGAIESIVANAVQSDGSDDATIVAYQHVSAG